MENDSSIRLLSITATSSTICLFLCGLQICMRIRQRGSTEGTGVAPFWLTSVSCVCWFGYGVLRNDDTIKLVNGVGLAFQTIYFVYYYLKTRLRHWLHKLILIEFLICLWTIWFVKSDYLLSSKENFLGVICMFLNIATIGSPLLDVGQVIRTQSTESLPFMLCAANMTVSVQWLLYGFLTDDFYMKVPNTVAVIISAIQLSLFIIYPSKHKIVSISKDTENLL